MTKADSGAKWHSMKWVAPRYNAGSAFWQQSHYEETHHPNMLTQVTASGGKVLKTMKARQFQAVTRVNVSLGGVMEIPTENIGGLIDGEEAAPAT